MNSIMFDFGIIQLQWYSFFIFMALLFGGTIVIRESRRFGISEDFMINLFFYMVPIAIIGARLYFVAFNWDYYSQNYMEIIKVWNGGLAIHGGLLFGFLWLIAYAKKHQHSAVKLLDMLAPALLLGQAIGRWGNFFNQEAYGPATTLKFLTSIKLPDFIINGMLINGVYHQPTFLYESIFCLIGFIVIIAVRHNKYIKLGQQFSIYLVWYGVVRLLIEGLRTDSLMLYGIKTAQIVSIFMIVIGIINFIYRSRGSIFDNRYNDGGGIIETNH